MAKKLFNEIETVEHHSISDFLLDEEASIPKGRILTIGSLMTVLACILGVQDAFARHGSHSSHGSGSGGHSSHSSGGYGHSSHASAGHSNHSSSYNYHSNVAPSPAKPPAITSVLPDTPDTLKIPQILPGTIPPE